jgi:LIVCS family branched-chain amino acid:cation transporter
MKNALLIISTGFALFSMFFGSGNLVVPLAIGRESGGHFLIASLGLFLTGVLVPFMGVIAMMLFKGDTDSFFGSMGKAATFWCCLIILALMGPFGVAPRCITVAYGSFQLLFPQFSLLAFSIAFCAIIYLCTRNKNKIISTLGTFLTPFLLLSLGIIATMGILSEREIPVATTAVAEMGSTVVTAWDAFKIGFFKGYQTMDLLAAFFFSSFVLKHLAERDEAKGIAREGYQQIFLKAILIGGGLLSAVYSSLLYLGALCAPELAAVPDEQMLGVVAQQMLGTFSAPIVCIAVLLACFTTAVVLCTLFSDFFKKEVVRGKISASTSMLIVLCISCGVSTFQFSGIARILAPILEVLYPALIILTVINICSEVWGMKRVRWPIAATVVLNAVKLFI